MGLHVSTNNLNFNHPGGSTNIGFYGDHPLQSISVNIYSGTSAPNWATMVWSYNPTTNNGIIDLTIDPNTAEARSATIIISAREQVVNRDVTSLISINQSKGALTGTVTLDGIYVDNVAFQSAIMNHDSHNLVVELKASSTIEIIEAHHTGLWMRFVGYNIEETGDVNYNMHIFSFKVDENDSSADRQTAIYFDVTDVYGIQRTNYLNVVVNQSYEDSPYIYVEDIYTDAASKRISSSIDIRNVVIDSYTSNVSWITNLSLSGNYLEYDISENYTYDQRVGEITITGTSIIDSNTIEFTFRVHQERAATSEELPIWKDYLINASLSENVNSDIYYNVLVNNTIIYSGHSYAINNEIPQINVTEIVRDYLIDTTVFPRNPLILNVNNYMYVDVLSGESPSDVTTPVASLRYYYDYTFEDNLKKIRNDSVTKEIDPRQYVCFSFLNSSGESNQVRVTNGSQTFLSTITRAGITQFIDEVHGVSGKIIARYAGETETYTIKPTCSKYCLYYLNLLGGWDTLLFEGQTYESEQYDIKTKLNDYINTTDDFETQQYLKNIKNTYRLTTRYLTDEESRRMINVFRSPKAFLQNLETDEMFPVLINNKSTDIKTFKNQKRKFYTYTIELEESQQKFIKN